MSLFGKCSKSFIILLLSIFVVSCKSSSDMVSEKTAGKNNESNQVFIPEHLPSYAQIRIAKIIQDSEANRLTDSEADESFLLGKLLEEKRDFETAEKLFTVSFNSTKSISSGLSLTNSLVNLKKFDQALATALKLSVLYPQRPEIEMILATIYQMQGANDSVIKTLERAYKNHPNNESIVIFYVSNIKKNSKKILENFLAKNPRATNVMLALSQKYFQEKNNMGALKYAKSAYFLDPDNIDIMTMIGKIEQHQKNYLEAEKYFRLAFEKEIDNNLNAQNYINILLYQKKMQEALAILLKLETSSDEQVPFPPEFSFQIAKILLVNKDFEGARKRLTDLSNSKYNNPAIKYYLAICCEALRKFQDAIEYLNEIPAESELFQESRKAKILIYINSNNKEEAEKHIEKFVISDQDIIEDSIFKSNILAYFSNYKGSIDVLNEALKKEPNAKELYLKKAEYIKYTDSESASIQFAEQIITKWPNYADGLNFLGYSLLENSIRLEYAKKVLHKAVAINPQNGFYLDSLGWLYFQKNDLKNSMKYIVEALKYEPDEPVIIYHLAIVQWKELQYEKSLKNLEMTSKILADMLPYQLESDPEFERISKSIGSKIIEVKKIIETQTQKKNLIGIL
jgi:tetratricopeptide (TPR) repeat protein